MTDNIAGNGNHNGELPIHPRSNDQGASALLAAIAKSIKSNGRGGLVVSAQRHLEKLCREFASDIEAGRITREHMKMIVAEDTGVEIEKLT